VSAVDCIELLVLSAGTCAVAFDIRDVLLVLSPKESPFDEHVDLRELMGFDPQAVEGEHETERVLVVRGSSGQEGIWIRGELTLLRVSPSDVVPVPETLGADHPYRGVLIRNHRAVALVLEPRRITNPLVANGPESSLALAAPHPNG